MLGENPTGTVAGGVARVAPAGTPGAPRSRRVLSVLSALRRALTPAPGSAWRDPVILVIAALTCGAYFVISLYRLLQLVPSSYDMGIYTEFVRQLAQLHAPIDDALGAGFNLEGNHFQIAVGVIAPFFRLFPTAGTLLFFQALFAALSVFPVVTVALQFTGRRSTARLIGFAYAFSWGLQQMINDDFHEIALAVPLLAFAIAALVRRRPGAAIAWAVPLVFVKEDQGFTVAAIGLLLGATAAFPRLLPGPPGSITAPAPARPAVSGRPAWRRWLAWLGARLPTGVDPYDYGYAALWGGLFLVTWGLFWSTFAITVIIPHFNPLHQYYFWTNGGAVGGGKPFSASALLVQAGGGWPTKAQTLALLFLPTAFAALGSPVALLAVPALALRFISTNQMFWGTGWHYNATVMPILFIAAVDAIGRWRRTPATAWPASEATASAETGRPASGLRGLVHATQMGLVRHGGAMMAAIAIALTFQFPLSNLWHSSTYKLDDHVAAADAAMAVVPDGATVTTTLDLLAPLGARTDTFWIGNAGNPVTQYIVFDGVNSGYSPPITDVPGFVAHWYPNDGYQQVYAADGVYVFRRG
ncbi:MAG TPA: DUF2079 domain-containing protein [Trebonia sp.]|nr:DUF2079 domain-containing protein [Trebonia sp.]